MTHTIDRDGDLTVNVVFTLHKARLGATDGRHGPKIEMDEPAWIEIDDVTDQDGDHVETTDQEDADILDEINNLLEGDTDEPAID